MATMTIAAANPDTGEITSFGATGALHEAIHLYGFRPLRPDGTYYVVQSFEGGYLLDGAPINAYIEGVWYAGQKELLQPFWDNGTIPTPPANIINPTSTPVVVMPPEVQANYNEWLNTETGTGSGTIFGLPTPVVIVGAGLLAWKLFKK